MLRGKKYVPTHTQERIAAMSKHNVQPRAATVADIDALAAHLPLLGGLGRRDRQALADQMLVHAVPEGAAIVRSGEAGNSAFFILEGRAVAGCQEEGVYHRFETLGPGDLFGEIAALTGLPRTADVVAEQPTTLLQLPAAALRQIMADARMRRYLLSRMAERMAHMDLIEPPRRAAQDWDAARYSCAASPVATIQLPMLWCEALN
jgi:signal-transduction protein with cAMP-binding, CBS, and nucleotidyltransferase domain